MSTHYSSAWGTTLRSQGLRRQLKQESSGEPLPGFFQKKFQGFPGGQAGSQSQDEPSFADGAAASRAPQASHRMPFSPSKSEYKAAPKPSLMSSSKPSSRETFARETSEREEAHFYESVYGEASRRMDGHSGRSSVLSSPSLKKFLPFSVQRRRGEGDTSESLASFGSSEIIFSMNKGSLIALIFSLICLVLFSMAIGFFFGISISGGPAPAPAAVVSTPPLVVAPHVDVPAASVAAAPVPVGPGVRRPVPSAMQTGTQHGAQQVKKEVVVRTLPVDMDTAAFSRPYSLQVGEFSQKESAQKWVNVLRKRGYDAYLVARYEGQNAAASYAVRMGGYYTKQAAATAAQYLKNSERFKTISIARNQAEVIS